MHRAAVYVDRPEPAGMLVIAVADVGGIPGGVLVAGASDLRLTGIRPGMTVRPSPAGWSIPAAGVEIDASRAVTWSPTLPAAATLRSGPGLARTVSAARRLAAARAPAGGLGPLISGAGGAEDLWLARARVLIAAQGAALRGGDAAAAIGPSVALDGLGVGLTPSGDDFLVGLLAGLEASGDPARLDLAAAIAASAPLRTTAIGAAALLHACRGAFSERLHDLLVALALGRLEALAAPIERAMAYGATSGIDTLVGVFSALDVAIARSAVTRTAAA